MAVNTSDETFSTTRGVYDDGRVHNTNSEGKFIDNDNNVLDEMDERSIW